MTINKYQGQTLQVVGVHLESPCFSHGQLYVACSRVSSPRNLFIPIRSKLKNLLRHPTTKRPPKQEIQSNLIYRIPCKSCTSSYIGETGKTLIERLNQHKTAFRNHSPLSLLVDHAIKQGHIPDFENAIVFYSNIQDKHSRLFLESWASIDDQNSINRKIDIPQSYQQLKQN
ncbi:hypothetical protein LAZ67_13000980 [Cordylochernes scorpioides]|uniref:GIY-YIG homing endonuclease n=1 Tax=Cordylochernes scorpioides TaxID=51811 RepID=A0ABY6L3E7_9ARAC|nr:hypothetical protein LAZ67_13000980 [Cordylochernes scorpioides]